MPFNSKLNEYWVTTKRQVVAVSFTVLSLLVVSLPVQAFEIGVTGLKGTENDTQGYSFFIADKFSRRSNLYWNLGVHRYDDVLVEWNNSELIFPLDSVELSLSYRHQLGSRNPAKRGFSMEYQLGVAASLTENKFTWATLDEEKYFSEKGDGSVFLAISTHYKMSSNISAIMGIKHFPDMFEFGSMSSVFLGVKVNLDFGPKYYGN